MPVVLVSFVVEVTADLTVVAPGGAAVLNCTDFRCNPEDVHYSWMLDGVSLPGETTPTLLLTSFSMGDAGTYSCSVVNDIGTGMGNITIRLGSEVL